ncbi:hypothetical protein JCM15519_19910 [Fundidesulfovibrio butyratiphilus]
MHKRIVTLVVAALAVVTMSSLAMAQPWGRGMGGWLAQVPQEKREQVLKIFSEGRKKIYDLESRKWDKQAELNVELSSAKPDSAKIEALAKEIGTLGAQAYQERVALQQRILKDTGVNLPLAGGCGGSGMGMGMGRGRGHGGYGMGYGPGGNGVPPCVQYGQTGQGAQTAPADQKAK